MGEKMKWTCLCEDLRCSCARPPKSEKLHLMNISRQAGARRSATPGRWSVPAALLIAACVIGFFVHAHSYDYVVDDAYISFRYARNLVEGQGLVFNHGERVEGYTDFLWVVLIALGMKMGADPVRLAKALCFGFTVLSMVVIYYYCGRIFLRRRWERLLPVAMIAVSPPLAVWALGGLETAMFTFLVTTAVLAHVDLMERGKRPLISSALIGLASLTRPEGLIFAAVLLVDMVLKPRSRRNVLLWLVPLAVIYVPYFVWRYSYYGWLFPNSFYAKTGGGFRQILRGLRYARDFLVRPGGVVCLLAIVPAVRKHDRKTLLPLLICVVWACYVVAVGGDGLAMYRFAVPVLPICYLLSAEGLWLILRRIRVRTSAARTTMRLGVVAVCLLAGLSLSLGSKERDFVLTDRMLVEGHWIPIGKWLSRYAQPNESIAVGVVGAIPYYSRLYTIDMLGITDLHIAHLRMPHMGEGVAGHEKHDMSYIVARRPTYIIHYPFRIKEAVITPAQFENDWNPGLVELLDMPAFLDNYEAVSEEIGGRRIDFFRLKQRPGGAD
jgi:arabinofuranosyltransferase